MNFIMIGLLISEALDRVCVRLNMYLVIIITKWLIKSAERFNCVATDYRWTLIIFLNLGKTVGYI